MLKLFEITINLDKIEMGNLVIKDNALITASHRLSEVEQRLILLAIVKARKQCHSVEELRGKELIIHADDYIQEFGATQQGAYKALKQAVMGLFEAKWGYKYLTDKGEQRVRYERFTQSADYGQGEGTVIFRFADAIIPMLVELEKCFTVYEIGQVAQLSSQYAMRLYEFFMQHLDKKTGKGWLDISLDELRFRFGLLPTEYKTMSNFKAYVLDFALKQINERTDLIATYEQCKKGRTIVGFNFEFERKTKVKSLPESTKDKKAIDLFEGLTDSECQAIQERINDHITRLEANGELVSDFHRQNIAKKAVAERWGVDIFERKQEQERAEQERREKAKAEKLAQEQEKQAEQEQAEQRKNAMIAKFESLPPDEQERILDEISQTPIAQMWKYNQKRADGVKVYKEPMFANLFYQYFDL